MHSSRSFSSGLHHSVSSSESLPGSPTHSLSPGPSTPCRSPAPDHQTFGESFYVSIDLNIWKQWGFLVLFIVNVVKYWGFGTFSDVWYLKQFFFYFLENNSPQSTSPCSSSPSSPAAHIRPSSLHGLGSKLSTQRYTKVGRRKSTSNIPPSPLACTSSSTSAQQLSPQRSPSPLSGFAKSLHTYHGKTLSPPTIVRHIVRPRSAEPPRSPLLKRVQSAEKLSVVYHGDKKSYAPRRHTLEVPFYGEGDLLGDSEAEGACGVAYIGADHSRLGGYIGSQRMRDCVIERSEQLVVMRKLNLSERRDSFKKQEAVQEVSFDEPEEKTNTTVTVTTTTPKAQTQQQQHRMAWVLTQPQTSEEVELEVPVVRRFTLVPQIAVQGSTESEQDEWEPCSDGEETNENPELEAAVTSSQPIEAGRPLVDGSGLKTETTPACPQDGLSTGKIECREEGPQKGHLRKWCTRFNHSYLSLHKLWTDLKTLWAGREWKILLEFCNCKYLPQGIAYVLVLFITFVNYDALVTGKEGSSHRLNSQGSTFCIHKIWFYVFQMDCGWIFLKTNVYFLNRSSQYRVVWYCWA